MRYTGTQAGWYPDPEHSGQNRYWDGTQWAAPSAQPETSPGLPAGGGPSGKKAVLVVIAVLLAVLVVGGGVFALTSGGDDDDDDGEVATRDDDEDGADGGVPGMPDDVERSSGDADLDEFRESLVEDFDFPPEDAQCLVDEVEARGLDLEDVTDPDPNDEELVDELIEISEECIDFT